MELKGSPSYLVREHESVQAHINTCMHTQTYTCAYATQLIATSAVVMDDSNAPLIGLGEGSAKTRWSRQMIPVGSESFEVCVA